VKYKLASHNNAAPFFSLAICNALLAIARFSLVLLLGQLFKQDDGTVQEAQLGGNILD